MNVCKKFLEKISKHWVVHKKNRFSAIPVDQIHEVHNALVKEGGAIGLTENPDVSRSLSVPYPPVTNQPARNIMRKDCLTKRYSTSMFAAF